jgi:hypothetical protein
MKSKQARRDGRKIHAPPDVAMALDRQLAHLALVTVICRMRRAV